MNPITLVNFVDLSLAQKRMVLSWRNNPDIKKWMYTQDDIKEEDHLNFIDSLRTREDKKYFLVRKGETEIGVIDFNDIQKDSCIMGIYSNPNISGVGKLLIEEIINYGFNILKVEKIFSEVFKKNERGINLYKKYGFKEIDIKEINNQKVICMELVNENW